MKQRIARRNAVANRENVPAQPRETRRIEITREQVSEVLRDHPEARDDARTWILVDAIGQYEEYTVKLEWLARNMADEVRKNEAYGMPSVYDTIMSTSLIRDIAEHAAKFTALKRVLQTTCRRADDPTATVVDTLIRTLNP
jgi:hypothetical protein